MDYNVTLHLTVSVREILGIFQDAERTLPVDIPAFIQERLRPVLEESAQRNWQHDLYDYLRLES